MQLTLKTANIAIPLQWKSARTGLSVVSGTALGSPGTNARVAQRLAFFATKTCPRNIVTLLIGSTVSVTGAPCLNTGNDWVALQAWRTHTNSCVEINLTPGSCPTNCREARINTFL